MPRTFALAAALATTVGGAPLLGGCRDSTEPRARPAPITGTFELRLVDGQPLPVTVRTRFAGGAEFTLRSGGASFTTGSGLSDERQLSLSYAGDSPDSPGVHFGSTQIYSQPVADSVVALEGAGSVRGDTFVFRTMELSTLGAHEWRYARVAAP